MKSNDTGKLGQMIKEAEQFLRQLASEYTGRYRAIDSLVPPIQSKADDRHRK